MNLIDALGWTLVHFLWQGALIAILLAAALFAARPMNSRIRYAAACGALLLMVVCAAGTFIALRYMGDQPTVSPLRSGDRLMSPILLAASSVKNLRVVDGTRAAFIPILVWTWLAGVLALSIRSLGWWMAAQRLAHRYTVKAEPLWDKRFAALVERLRISAPVRLAVSALAEVPAVVGWIRPVVLVPASVFTGLTTDQIEALLAHELAHVLRQDYLINLLQAAAETLLFHHPAVWWVNHIIRTERENCCDDVAVAICGDKLLYVRALTGLEQMRDTASGFAMAADGGSLLGRVQRLLGMHPSGSNTASGWLAGLSAATCLLAIGFAVSGFAQGPGTQVNKPPVLAHGAPTPVAAQAGHATWLDGIQGEGYRDLTVDQLVELKIHGVDGAYIRQMRAEGFQLTTDQLVEFRIHGIAEDFVHGLKQGGMQNLKADEVIALKIHGAEPAWIRDVRSSLGANLTADEAVELRIQGLTPELIRDAKSRFKNITLDQLVQLKRLGILQAP